MNSIILAAGYGKRFKLENFFKPKCLLKIYKKNLLYYLIKDLLVSNIDKIFIVIGYKKNLITKYVKDNFKINKKIIFIENKKFKKYGNSYSALLACRKVSGPTLLLNADIITPKNSIKNLIYNKKKNLFLSNTTNFFDEDDIRFKYDEKKKVKKIFIKNNKISSHENFVSSAGVTKFSKSAFKNFYHELKKLDIIENPYYETAFNGLIKKNNFFIFPQKIKTLEIDKSHEYTKVLKILKRENEYL